MQQENRLPAHVAIILDGNGRWAAEHGKKRSQGHLAGARQVEVIGDALIEREIRYFTVYAFSTENWNRPAEEVSYLMGLLKQYLIRNKKDALRRGIRIRVLGDRSRLPQDLQELVAEVEAATAHLETMTMQFAISYGGRDEIVRAARKLAQQVKQGELEPEQIDEARFAACLDTAGVPDPDLMIRTSGEQRISNFLLWQLAYGEFYFSPKYWPDFTPEDLDEALKNFASRDRRFGGREKR